MIQRTSEQAPEPLALPDDVARRATLGDAWRSSHWTMIENVRRSGFWLILCMGLLVPLTTAFLVAPDLGWLRWVWLLAAVVPLYLVTMFVISVWLTWDPGFSLLVSPAVDAVIGFRRTRRDGSPVLLLQHHIARHVGTGEGRAFRQALAPTVMDHLRRHPEVSLALTAQNASLLVRYQDELLATFPAEDGWVSTRRGRRLAVRFEPGTSC